jgi:hypothetical protein
MTGGHIRISRRLAEVVCPSKFSWKINGFDLDMSAHLDIDTFWRAALGARLEIEVMIC